METRTSVGMRRRTAVVLSTAIGVAAATTGVLGALFLATRADTAAEERQVTLAEQQLRTSSTRLAAVESTVDGLERRLRDLEAANAQLAVCADPAKASVAAALNNDDAALSAAIDQIFVDCAR